MLVFLLTQATSGSTLAVASGGSIVTPASPTGYECVLLGDDAPRAEDRLSDPAVDDLFPSLVSLLPRGRAWQTDEWSVPSGSTILHRFFRAVTGGLAYLYRTATSVTLNSTIVTADESAVDDWEQELGLPGPCFDLEGSLADRRLMARLKLLPGGACAAFFICAASRFGVYIEIEDGVLPFEAGRSGCGGDDGCGDNEFAWYISLASVGRDEFFEAGLSEAGLTPLGQRPRRSDLECFFQAIKPAHTLLYFRYVEGFLSLEEPALTLGGTPIYLSTVDELGPE